MRVVLVSPYSPRALTGVGIFTSRLAGALRERGHDTCIVAPSPVRATLPAPEGLVEVRLPPTPGRDIALAAGTVRALRRGPPADVVHLQQAHLQGAAVLLATKGRGCVRVATLHLRVPAPQGPLRAAFNRFSERTVTRASDRVAYVCQATARQFAGAAGEVIPNGVDVDHFAPDASARTRLRATLPLKDELVILFSGRWDAGKGLFDAFDALARLRSSGQVPFLLLLVGGGSTTEVEQVSRAVRQRDLGSVVRMVGPVVDPRPYYRMADVFLLPSHFEGLPLALLEAMACGLPPVAAAVGGVPEAVRDGENGFLVPPRDASTLAAVLASLPTRNLAKVGRHARETVVDQYALGRMVDRYLALYEAAGAV